MVPGPQVFPYDLGGAGDINSTIEDMARWVRLQLGNGSFEGRRIVSPENLAFTRTPKVAMSDKISYALGWVIQHTQNGNIVWHDGGTSADNPIVPPQLTSVQFPLDLRKSAIGSNMTKRGIRT